MTERFEFQEKKLLLETPLDDLNRVDLDGLIKLGLENIPDDYDWNAKATDLKQDIHHMQWISASYPDGIERDFRSLKNRKVLLLRGFHDLLHRITDTPPIPSKDVMQESIQAEDVAINLTKMSRIAMDLPQKCPTNKLHKVNDNQQLLFEKYCHYSELAAQVPPEFQLVTPDQIKANDVEQMLERAVLLGQLALDTVPNRVDEVINRFD